MDRSSVETIPGGSHVPPSYFIDEVVEFRRYCCPSCHVLMTTEVVTESEPVTAEMRIHGRD